MLDTRLRPDRMPDDRPARRTASVEIVAVTPAGMSALRNLFQFYEYDFSEIEAAWCCCGWPLSSARQRPVRSGVVIQADGHLAGFALVNRQTSHVIDGEAVWWMEEFFIMRGYRRTSLGRQAAQLVIERHPGTWEVTQTPNNHAALAFWHNVLAAYGYEEFEFDDPKMGRRPLQRFSIPEPRTLEPFSSSSRAPGSTRPSRRSDCRTGSAASTFRTRPRCTSSPSRSRPARF